MNNKTKKVALFGGSFNPIHNSHISIIKELLKRKLVDEVWVIPCKKHAFNKNFAPAKHRVKMIKLAIKNIKNARINRVELNYRGTTYTIKTIKKLKSKHLHRFFWTIGSDVLNEIKIWQDYKKLLEEIEFIVFKRKGYPIIKVRGLKIANLIKKKETGTSSTEIRKRVKEGKSLKGLVPLSIKEYIEKESLYKQK